MTLEEVSTRDLLAEVSRRLDADRAQRVILAERARLTDARDRLLHAVKTIETVPGAIDALGH